MAHEPRRQPEMEPEHDPDAVGPEASSERAVPGGLNLSQDLIGQTLAGRYRFEALVGEGTFARVYRVYDEQRRVSLAAKVLRSDIAQEPAFLARFRREAAVLQRLQHPHIVRYYDIVESGDTVFILTDFIAGRTLQAEMRRLGRPMTPEESLKYLAPLSAALHFAHSEGVVHRDLKPANILIDANENLYVTDFGIARILSDTSTLTMDTTVGTPHYMSPEQIMVGRVTEATDVYALGVMLYQMYTGELPFTGNSEGAAGTTTAVRIVYEHLHMKPAPPQQVNPALSAAVGAVVLRCMEKDPGQRYASVSAVYDALTTAIGTVSAGGWAQPEAVHSPSPEVIVEPEGERVPTGVGGASRIAPADESLPEEVGAESGDWRWEGKPKRKAKRDARRAARAARRAARDPARMSEKEREKERQSDEKNQEKSQEKGTDFDLEKNEFWGDIAPNDQLSQFVWGGMVLWAGIVFLLGLSSPWSWVLGGAGALLLVDVAARLAIPQFRARPGARLVMGVVFLMIGLGLGVSFASIWPLILIAIGASMLISRLVE